MKILSVAAAAGLALGALGGTAQAADLGGYEGPRFEKRSGDRHAPRIRSGALLDGIELAQFRRRARCVAVGRTIRGRRIRGTRRVGRGVVPRRACRRALRQCRRALRRRQRVGLNPLGQCRVARVRPIRRFF